MPNSEKGFFVQGSKQEVTKVISLSIGGEKKTWRFTHTPQGSFLLDVSTV